MACLYVAACRQPLLTKSKGITWCGVPGVMTAKVIEAHAHLSVKLLRQKWFDCPAAEAIEIVNAIVGRFRT
jgi:hypothetical protein